MFWSLAHKALRVKSISDIEHVSTLLQDGAGLLLVHHGRREQRQARVVMFFVVPTKKSLRESATVLNAAEAVGKLRTIFHGAELTLRVAPAVSQRTPVSCSMRRSGHPSRPRAMTCCFFASLKTLLISTKAICLTPKSTSRASFSLAGFQVTLIGRFWVTPEASHPRQWPLTRFLPIVAFRTFRPSNHSARLKDGEATFIPSYTETRLPVWEFASSGTSHDLTEGKETQRSGTGKKRRDHWTLRHCHHQH